MPLLSTLLLIQQPTPASGRATAVSEVFPGSFSLYFAIGLGKGGNPHRTFVVVVVVVVVVTGKDETPDIEDLGSVLRDSSIQTLRLPTKLKRHSNI